LCAKSKPFSHYSRNKHFLNTDKKPSLKAPMSSLNRTLESANKSGLDAIVDTSEIYSRLSNKSLGKQMKVNKGNSLVRQKPTNEGINKIKTDTFYGMPSSWSYV
jgi:hypothetical protein